MPRLGLRLTPQRHILLEAAEDAQGTEKNKVVKVKPSRRNKPDASKSKADGSEGELVQIPL